MADDLASALDGIRAIEQAATRGPWQAVRGTWEAGETFPAVISRDGDPAKAETWLMAAGRGSMDPESNAAFTAMARTAVPRLLAAVEAALAFHEEFDGHCGSCCDAYGDPVEWPCEEFTDITAALAGKEAGNGG